MPKPELIYEMTLKHVVARAVGVSLLVLSPLAVSLEFFSRYGNGLLDLGEFVEDTVDFYDDIITLIAKGAA